GEMLAPALAEATAVAETEGEAGGVAGVGAWPNAVKARAIELRQVKIVVFIVSLVVRCGRKRLWIQKKALGFANWRAELRDANGEPAMKRGAGSAPQPRRAR